MYSGVCLPEYPHPLPWPPTHQSSTVSWQLVMKRDRDGFERSLAQIPAPAQGFIERWFRKVNWHHQIDEFHQEKSLGCHFSNNEVICILKKILRVGIVISFAQNATAEIPILTLRVPKRGELIHQSDEFHQEKSLGCHFSNKEPRF